MEFGLAIGFIIISLVALKLCRQCAGIVAVIYFLAIIYIAFISREPAPYLRYSFNPFGAVKRGLEFGCGVLQGIFSCDIRVTSWVSLKGIILNILLFVPFGYLLPTLFPRLNNRLPLLQSFLKTMLNYALTDLAENYSLEQKSA